MITRDRSTRIADMPPRQSSPTRIDRRTFLRRHAMLAAGALLPPSLIAASTAANKEFQRLYDGFASHMRRLYQACEIQVDGHHLLRPCNHRSYHGLWHDDFTWPHIGLPELQQKPQLKDAVDWLGEAMLQLPVVADRVEYDGTAVMSPGAAKSQPLSEAMPIHLPAAWTRLLSYAEASGVSIPHKQAWAQLIRRSFNHVSLSFGLVWNDPQRHIVAFGFQDSIHLTGLVCLTSLIVKRGLERATSLFASELAADILTDWNTKATGIASNLHRLFDTTAGGFLGATVAGRTFDVWGNGLAWPLATPSQKKIIADTLISQKNHIFRNGCTRQIIGPKGWPDTASAIAYQNGGYWGTGTGFVLPMIAEIDPAWAASLAGELLTNLEAINYAEWIDDQATPHGAMEFLATLSMPLIGLRAILEQKHVIDLL